MRRMGTSNVTSLACAPSAPRPLDAFPHFSGYRDPDQIRVEVAKHHCDHIYKVRDSGGQPNAWINALPMQDVTFTSLGYGVESFVRPGQLDCYVVMYVCAGSGRFQYGLDSVERTAGQAVVVSTRKPLAMTLSDDFVVACLWINEPTLKHHLEGALDDAPTEPLEFDLSMNGRDERVDRWQKLFSLELQELNSPTSLLHSNRLMTYHTVGLMLSGLVHAWPHSYTERIERTSHASVPSRRVRQVLDYVAAQPAKHHTLASLAGRACCSEEALNKAFNRDIGVPPMACVRLIRAQGAHCELMNSDPSTTTVRYIVGKWGFRMNHFAALHGRCFGESPGATLRRTGRPSARAEAISIAQLKRLWAALRS